MNKHLYKNLIANELTKIKKENRYRIFNEIKKDDYFPLAKKAFSDISSNEITSSTGFESNSNHK